MLTIVTITDQDKGPFAGYRASYAGLLRTGDGLVEGQVKLTIAASGNVSGVVTIANRRCPFKGELDAKGVLRLTIFKGEANPLELTLRLDQLMPEAGQVRGSFSDSGEVFEFFAYRNVFKAKQNPSRVAGHYVVAFDPDPSSGLPPGSGYALLTVAKGGAVRISGKLADGVAIAGSTFLTLGEDVRFYIPIYKKAGVVSGILQFFEGDRWTCSGDVFWTKPVRERDRYYPNGFSGSLSASGVAVIPGGFEIPTSSQVQILISGGNLSTAIGPVSLERPLASLLRGPAELKLKVNRINGLMTGGFKHPQSGRFTALLGVFLPHEMRGAGFFMGMDTGGAIELNVSPPEVP
jgi:hypothetical protein